MQPSTVSKVLRKLTEKEAKQQQVDWLFLNSEERSSPHMLCCTEGGRSLRISMPRGIELEENDVLALDDNVVIAVAAKPEELFVIPIQKNVLEAAVVGYQLGNLHRPTRFTDCAVLTPADPMVADVLTRLGVMFESRNCPFVGRRYGAITKPHSHDHHSHSE